MNALCLDGYIGTDWSKDVDYCRILNNAKARKFQPPKKILVDAKKGNKLQEICVSRVSECQSKNRSIRFYEHKSYEYDSMNELERFGAGKYARRYTLVVSFEDCLDFIYSCVFKTKLGDLKKFCSKKNIDYKAYSRKHLAGGETTDRMYLSDLYGFSDSFDVILDSIGSDTSINKIIYINRLLRFCQDFRNALLLHMDKWIGESKEVILASIGITSGVYYSDIKIDESFDVIYKMYKIKLKILCVEHGKYFNMLEEDLCG